MKTAAVIPCRYKSSRLEGKPLALIGDKPMMWHVYQQALKTEMLEEVYIATDDERIAAACRDHGLNFLMTRPDHATGTDRVAECARLLTADIIVNIQGDEPFILPESIDAVARALQQESSPHVAATNGCARIHEPEEILDQSVVKVAISRSGRALSYSRLPIPLSFRKQAVHYRQLGLYAFRRESLAFFAATPQGPVEEAESVELFRFLEHDRAVLMVEVEEKGIAVDTPADLEKARRHHQEHP